MTLRPEEMKKRVENNAKYRQRMREHSKAYTELLKRIGKENIDYLIEKGVEAIYRKPKSKGVVCE